MSKELEQSEKLFEAIKILMELGEKDLAFQLRVAHDTHLRSGWKGTKSHPSALPLSVVVCVPKLPDWDKFYEYDTTIKDVADAHLVTIHFYENQKVESFIVYGEKFSAPLNDKEYFKHAETELKKFGTPYFHWLGDRFIGLCVSNLKELTNERPR
jgi:hypothetical protein